MLINVDNVLFLYCINYYNLTASKSTQSILRKNFIISINKTITDIKLII